MLRYLFLLICFTSVLWAASPAPCHFPGGAQTSENTALDWDGSMSAAVRQEEYAYYNQIYQLQAQLKSAMLKYTIMQEQESPDFTQLQEVIKTINNLRFQMDLAGVSVDQHVRSMLPRDQYRQWRAQWRPACGYEWSLLCNRDPNELTQAMALWNFFQNMKQPSQGVVPFKAQQPAKAQPQPAEESTDLLQQLPAQSMQRALQFSNS